MRKTREKRPLDLVLYGATGFVGRRAAQYLACHPQVRGLRWAIAGRDRDKLEGVARSLGAAAGSLEVAVADASDPSALAALAGRSRVLLNTAGPFVRYGDLVVGACVENRTHYVDITGETVWVRGLIDRHHARAARDGTRIIPCCGFDSVPSDLGCCLVVRRMQQGLGVACAEVRAYFQMYGGFNGGTLASNFARHDSGHVAAGRDPFLLDVRPTHRKAEVDRNRDPQLPRYDDAVGTWVGPFIMGPINTRVVRRSAALFAEWGEPYGPQFRYQEYTKFDPPLAHLKAAALTGAMLGLEQLIAQPPLRALLRLLLPAPGSGPSERAMNEGWFRTDLVGFAHDGRSLRGLITHQGDPGNRATVRFVCEAALALALDAAVLPGGTQRGGLLTPATGLGDAYARRLREVGVLIAIGA